MPPWFARSILPSAAQHLCGSAGGTTKKAVMVVRGDRGQYRSSEGAFRPRRGADAPTAKTTSAETGERTREEWRRDDRIPATTTGKANLQEFSKGGNECHTT